MWHPTVGKLHQTPSALVCVSLCASGLGTESEFTRGRRTSQRIYKRKGNESDDIQSDGVLESGNHLSLQEEREKVRRYTRGKGQVRGCTYTTHCMCIGYAVGTT